MRQTVSAFTKLMIVAVLFAVLFSYAMFQGGFVSWFLFFSFVPILGYSALLVLYPLAWLQVDRKLSRYVIEAGEQVEVDLSIRQKVFFPFFYMVIEDHLPDTLNWQDTKQEKYRYLGNPEVLKEKKEMKKILFPGLRRKHVFKYSLTHIPRGEHAFHFIIVKVGDPFGFVRKEKVFRVPGKLFVYPADRKLMLHQGVHSFEEGTTPSYTLTVKDTTVVSGVREYMPGDRFSWIDWKTTARKNNVMTKEFEQEKSNDVVVILDAALSRNGNWLAFEGAVETTMGLLFNQTIDAGRIHFICHGKDTRDFQINANERSREKVKRFLATIQPEQGMPFSKVLRNDFSRYNQGYAFMAVTTNLTRDLIETLMKLKRKNQRIVLFVITSEKWVSELEEKNIQHLQNQGILVNLLTEAKLMKSQLEVNA
ncbi:MAG: DUF58 domain-containing protein [Bacillaceae bacterium]|nr:DUF58 domain-containing protein [Bacillaceae bacterium]